MTTIDYLAAADAYRPVSIETLLVGEAPPPSGKTYFYVPTTLRRFKSIRENRTLPATIFHHYFGKLPADEGEYATLLRTLKQMGAFLVDIVDEPIHVRNSPEGIQKIKAAIPMLRGKMKRRSIEIPDRKIIFLLARKNYRSEIRREFPKSQQIPWIDFRMSGPEKWG